MSNKFPPRIRGYYDGDPYMFCPEQWEVLPSKHPKSDLEFDFISTDEHEHLLAEAVRAAKAPLLDELKEINECCNWWMEQHDALKNKYEPMIAVLSAQLTEPAPKQGEE